jgi:hypothetical protein
MGFIAISGSCERWIRERWSPSGSKTWADRYVASDLRRWTSYCLFWHAQDGARTSRCATISSRISDSFTWQAARRKGACMISALTVSSPLSESSVRVFAERWSHPSQAGFYPMGATAFVSIVMTIGGPLTNLFTDSAALRKPFHPHHRWRVNDHARPRAYPFLVRNALPRASRQAKVDLDSVMRQTFSVSSCDCLRHCRRDKVARHKLLVPHHYR